ncbi:MAG: hypothetical protein RL637_775 [Pseudomonadota bacterium]|jgi:hypothetical protein
MFQFIQRVVLLSVSSILLCACEPSASTSTLISANSAASHYQTATELRGKVNDDQGLIETGQIQVFDAKQQLVISAPIVHGDYHLVIPAQTLLPLSLIVKLASNANSLKNIVIYPNIHHYDVNPFTTEIARQALLLGGYTPTNLRQAAENASINAPKDPKKRYGGWH